MYPWHNGTKLCSTRLQLPPDSDPRPSPRSIWDKSNGKLIELPVAGASRKALCYTWGDGIWTFDLVIYQSLHDAQG
jgi:hypothetical protein